MSLAGCQINPIDVNFHLQKSLEVFDKNSANKFWSKKDKGWKVPSHMPIRVKMKYLRYNNNEHTVGTTLQMFTGIYRDSAGKLECGDFKFMGIACIPAIPVILKSPHSDFHVKIVGILTLQGYYGDTPH